MNQIVPFEGGAVPAHLQGRKPIVDDALSAHAGKGGFPSISIKGKTFAIIRDKERTIVMNPKDPESAASNIEVVIVKGNKGVSKVFYPNGYIDGQDIKPDCFSNDGIKPDSSVTKPQCKTCALCPKNAWGSKITDAGKKSKACNDSIRIAVAAPDKLDDPFLLRVPAASIRSIGEYSKFVNKKGYYTHEVVTKISFDPAQATPLLVFKAVGFISEEGVAQALESAESDIVQRILGDGFGDHTPIEEGEDTDDAFAAAPARKPVNQEPEKVAPLPAVVTKEKKVSEAEVVATVAHAESLKAASMEDVEIDLDGLSFDD